MQLRCENKSLIIIQNKIDKTSGDFAEIKISAKMGEGIDALEEAIYKAADIPEITENGVIVTNARHYEALTRAQASIQRVIDGMQMQLSGDLLSEDLRQALDTLSEITGGQITPNEVLGNIFKHFCVGK